MVDGAASLMTMTYAFRQLGLWTEGRGVNVLDTGAPFYEVYDTADGKWFCGGRHRAAVLRRAAQRPRPRRRASSPPRTTGSSGRP